MEAPGRLENLPGINTTGARIDGGLDSLTRGVGID